MADWDGIVIGGGHNGLTCAAYLARAGARVLVLERNPVMGGGTTTSEVTLPGFRHNMHANYFIGFDLAPIVTDLELGQYGFEFLTPDVQHACIFRDHRAFVIQKDLDKTVASAARFSPKDADQLARLYQRYAIDHRRFFAELMFSPPRTPDEFRAAALAEGLDELGEIAGLRPYEAIDRHFEDEHIRVFFKKLLHIIHANDFTGVGMWFPNLVANVTASTLPVGGAASLPNALAKLIEAHRGEVRINAHVSRILVKDGKASGVVLADGNEINSGFVVSGIDFPQTIDLAGPTNFDAEIGLKARNWRWTDEHSLMTLHLALDERPSYRAVDFDPDVKDAYNVQFGADNTGDLLQMFDEMRAGLFPSRPAGNGCVNSMFDPTYAPAGKHVAFWWPFASYELSGRAETWDSRRQEYCAQLTKVWEHYAPNVSGDNVLASYLYTPYDIPRYNLSMVRGSVRLGAYTADQMGRNRPHALHADYRAEPVEGLYLCSSSSASGGGVNGAPGYNAAGIIAGDGLVDRWWPQFAD